MRLMRKPDDGEFAAHAIKCIGLLPDDGRVLEHVRPGGLTYIRTRAKGETNRSVALPVPIPPATNSAFGSAVDTRRRHHE